MGLHQDSGPVGRVLQGVRYDVGEELAESVLVAFHGDSLLQIHLDVVGVPGIGDDQRLNGLIDEIGKVEVLDLQAGRPGLHP